MDDEDQVKSKQNLEKGEVNCSKDVTAMETDSCESKEKNARTSENSNDTNISSEGDGVKRKKEDNDTENNCDGKEVVCEGSSNHSTTTNNEKEAAPAEPAKTVSFKVMFNKQKYDVTFDVNKKISDLKAHIQTLTGVPSAMQKLMFKGLVKDDKTLQDLDVKDGAKFMLVGSKPNDVLQVNKPVDKKDLVEAEAKGPTKEPFCKQKLHKKVLDKGIPEDVKPGIKNVHEALPNVPISGMINKAGGKVRLTFKLEIDQVWIGTKERTEKIPMNNIKAVVSEPIDGHEEYHIMGIQLGTTEASRYWMYWVPAQYVNAIKDTILGKWHYY